MHPKKNIGTFSMIQKKIILIFLFSVLFSNNVYSDSSRVKGYTGISSSKDAILQAKEMCGNIGFKKESSKFNDCVIKLVSTNSETLKKEQEVTNIENNDSQYVFTGNATFGTSKKTKKHNKKVAMYMKMPEKILCISYINNYGVFKKAKQAARTEAVRTRGIDCNPYMDDAYYDKERRNDELMKATHEAFNGVMDAEIEKHEQRAKNYRAIQNSSMTCKSRKSGSTVRTTCN